MTLPILWHTLCVVSNWNEPTFTHMPHKIHWWPVVSTGKQVNVPIDYQLKITNSMFRSITKRMYPSCTHHGYDSGNQKYQAKYLITLPFLSGSNMAVQCIWQTSLGVSSQPSKTYIIHIQKPKSWRDTNIEWSAADFTCSRLCTAMSHFLNAATALCAKYISKGVYKLLACELDTLTIKPSDLMQLPQTQQRHAFMLPPQLVPNN